jgi:UDP-N-acetylmuramoyl-tripeptide--D-alanyl-D-alanine ligase
MPLTLLEMSDNHKVAVIEMGMNHSGELDYLSKLASPSHAVVNNVLFAHAGHFNGLEDIAKAKGEIYHGLANDGLACVDMSSEFAKMWLENDIKIKNIFEFGRAESKCYIKNIDIDSATYVTPLGELQVSLKVLGKHNYINALTVIALAVNLGCSLADIKNGLEGYTGYKGRLERKVAFNDAIIIDDTYNANPDSVKAALSAIQIFNQEKWFIFADLKELGADEENIHINLTKDIQHNDITKLITVGKLAKLTSDNFSGDKLHFETNDDVVKYCMSHLPNNVVLLVKGSNSMRLFDIVNQIVKK